MVADNRQLKTGRFDIRWSEQELGLISEAAQLGHISVSAFVRQQAVAAAEKIVLEQTRFVLTAEQWNVLDAAFCEPPRVVPELLKQLSVPDQWDLE